MMKFKTPNSASATISDIEVEHRTSKNQFFNDNRSLFLAARCVLGGVDKFEPVSCGGDMNYPGETLGELVVSSGDGAFDF